MKRFLPLLLVLAGAAFAPSPAHAADPVPTDQPAVRKTSDDNLPAEKVAAQKKTQQAFKRGARPIPRHVLAALMDAGKIRLFKPVGTPPTQIAMIASKTSMWLNDQQGDCVSAEKAAAIAEWTSYCGSEYFIQDATVQAFCSKYSTCNGADLPSVDQAMQNDGMHQGSDTITMGPAQVVDYTNETTLQSALSLGPVEIGMAASELPSGAGSSNGWYAFGAGTNSGEDHCINICGYGSAAFCFGALGAPVPAGAPTGTCYIVYTWSTFGVVDEGWIASAVGEAYLRQPNVVINGKPITPPNPTPPVPPNPPTPPNPPVPTPPNPAPAGPYYVKTTDPVTGAETFAPVSGVVITADQKAAIEAILNPAGKKEAPPAPPKPPSNKDRPMPPPEPEESALDPLDRAVAKSNAIKAMNPGIYAGVPVVEPWDHEHSYVWTTPGAVLPGRVK